MRCVVFATFDLLRKYLDTSNCSVPMLNAETRNTFQIGCCDDGLTHKLRILIPHFIPLLTERTLPYSYFINNLGAYYLTILTSWRMIRRSYRGFLTSFRKHKMVCSKLLSNLPA
jgi:hypothetical protein